ncbi:MAG: vitamin K-dependent gamma-carboxylase [Bradymonadia bacterium]|jgi:vitamin K-dependent gamma-carboxylase
MSRLSSPQDIAFLVWMRVVIGALGVVAAARFLANGWVEQFFGVPTFFFHYPGLSWVTPLPLVWMQAAFGALVVLSFMVMIGAWYRVAAGLYVLLFVYVELCDVTNYLNHYYLMTLLGVLAVVLPMHRAGSVDALRRPETRVSTVPAWMLWLLRGQIAVVYVYAGLAKFQADWLLHAQPLNLWLFARTEFPVIGGLFAQWETALVFSWAGFLFDTTVVGFLLWRRTRLLAYVALVGFHAMTSLLFNIGMFPLIMTLCATVFFSPSTLRRCLEKARILRTQPACYARPCSTNSPLSPLGDDPNKGSREAPLAAKSPAGPGRARAPSPRGSAQKNQWQPRTPRLALLAAALWMAVQVALPMRAVAYSGPTSWHEQGMRWSWRVMVREKSADVVYRVRYADGRERLVPPSRYLTTYQEREMGGQPDLVLQLAHRIAADERERTDAPVQVYADVFASWNGRPAARLIDPETDLATIEQSWSQADWILPAPSSAPMRLDR